MSTLADLDFGSESDEGDFDPHGQAGSDDEDLNERHRARPKTKSSKRLSPAAEDDDEGTGNARNDDEDLGEDLDGDDDDEDEDDEVSGRPRKRVRRDQRNQFIDIEAEVDEEDEEGDEDEEADAAGFIAEDHPDDLGDLPAGAETDDRRHRELDRKREQELQMDAEKQAALLKERYGRSRTAASDTALVPKRLLLPSVDDPSVWGVRCKPGKEREVVMSIMKRVEERRFSKNPMPIISALERGGTMTGYVYIETRRQADIIPALDGIINAYPRTKIVLVPIKEMPDLLRVRKTESLQPGGYVRLRRGKYQGDLAQIDDVESNGLEVTLKIVPRLDYGLNDDQNAPAENGQGDKRKRNIGVNIKNRPPQRLFSEAEARKRHARNLATTSNLSTRKHFQYFGDTYINGYLIKDFRINHLQTEDVNPTLEEVTKFTAGGEDGNENLDLTALAVSLKNKSNAADSYLPGDSVEVFEGEQQGVSGTAVAVQGDIVTISVSDGELKGQRIDVPMKGLRKRFKEGDHVKIIGGSRFGDEVGLVVRIKDDQVTIVTDVSMQEITVFSKDLRVASDSGTAGGLGQYDIHDLVQLDPSTVGCVIKVDRESLRVLDQNGSVKTVMPSQITNKIEKRKTAVATDRNGSEIRHDDTVREIGGESKSGTIAHIHRAYLFLVNRMQTENSGLFVVRASNVATVAAKGGRVVQQASSGPDLTKMNPALQRNGASNGSMPPPKSFGRDRLVGQTVKVRKGPYKGLLGIVKDTTDSEARVELHSKNKTISLGKELLGVQDAITGNNVPYSEFIAKGRGGGMRPSYGGATPSRANYEYSGSRTPTVGASNGGRTPAWGASRTPAWGAGGRTGGGGFGGSSLPSRTPAYNQDGGRTPGWAANDGGRTAYGGAGGRTPAWESGSRTAYGGPNSTSDGFGGKTPSYESSRTPAYASGSFHNSNPDPWARPQDAPTPATAFNAPTPSDPYNAPTPVASAPTPKYSGYGAMDAPTPAAGAPTPFSGNPETPAAWGGDDDDGPRYDDSPSP